MGRIHLILLFLLIVPSTAPAQFQISTDAVVTKNISKIVLLAPGEIFSVAGEKAHIYINGWDKNYIDLKISFSAEHSDRAIATREVEYMHYSLSREKNKVELRNAFILPGKTDYIRSRVKVVVQLMVPFSNTLLLHNKYGDTEIRDMSGSISVGLEFSDLMLFNVTGALTLQSSYSEVRGEDLALRSFTGSDEESKYILALKKGSYRFNSKHSDINLTLAGNIQSLAIDALHTGVTIQLKDFDSYNYEILSKAGKIYVPQRFGNVVEKTDAQSRVILTQKSSSPLIKVKTTFNTITLQ